MTTKKVQTLQQGINTTFRNAKIPWKHIEVDGDYGPTTRKAARIAGSWQGLSKEQLRNISDNKITQHIYDVLTHHKTLTPAMKKRQEARKKYFEQMREAHKEPPIDSDGVSDWQDFKVAAWMVGRREGPDGSITNWLQKSVDKGWDGRLTSGFRTPAYSESLCYILCNQPSCPGKCAGRSSNHSQIGPPNWGAIDVADYDKFGRIQKEIGSPLHNSLGAQDPVHFSYTGN